LLSPGFDFPGCWKQMSRKNLQPRPGQWVGWRAPVLIVLVCAAAHLWCLGSQFYLDDLWQIRDNTKVRNGTWWNSSAWQWTYLWYVIEARLFGMSPVGFHLVNWVLHTSVALVLYFAGRRFWRIAAVPALPSRVPCFLPLTHSVPRFQTTRERRTSHGSLCSRCRRRG